MAYSVYSLGIGGGEEHNMYKYGHTQHTRSIQQKSNHCEYNEDSLCYINVTWQPRRLDWNVCV